MKYLRQPYTWILFAFFAAPLQAEVYQWTDANGTVHFSSQPRIKGASKTVDVGDINVVAAPKPQSEATPPKADTSSPNVPEAADAQPLTKDTSMQSAANQAPAMIESDMCTKAKQKRRFGQQILDENIDEVGGVKIRKKHVKEMLATSEAQIKQFC